MIKFVFLFLFSVSVFGGSLSLYDLGYFVSKQTGKTVMFSDSVDQKFKVIFSSTSLNYLELFKTALKSKGYILKSDKTYFYVTVPAPKSDSSGLFGTPSLSAPAGMSGSSFPSLLPPPPLSSSIPANDGGMGSISVVNNGVPIYSKSMPRSPSSLVGSNTFQNPNVDSNGSEDQNISFKSLNLVYLQPSDIEDTLKFSGFQFSISKNSKSILFKVPEKKLKLFNNLVETVKNIDIPHKQVTLKIIVFTSNQNDLRDLGFSPTLSLDTNLSSSTGALFVGSLVASFYSSLHFLQSKGVTKITDTPTFLVSDNETLDFKSVVNMPFLDENFAFSATQGTNQSKKYKYKPIGFKVLAIPTIVGDTVYLDFTISFETVVTAGDLPITSEKSIKNKFSLQKGDLIVLAGISKQTVTSANNSLPFVSDIPYLGKLFSHDNKNDVDESFNISIEVMK